MRIADIGVALFFGKKQGGYTWDQVRQISFDDPGRTKANVGATVAFGVLGMAGRRAFTLITLSTDAEELYFESDVPIGQWRAAARRIVEVVFALPGERKYPILDKAHARNALARVAQNGTPAEQKKVKAAVKKRFPSIGRKKKS